MKVSGFTFLRDAVELYYPVVESITSILPICDELIVVAGDSHDDTTAVVRQIGDPKIRIIETVWDPSLFAHYAVYAQQTDIGLDACSGDWAFYIQGDEVMHERDLPVVRQRLEEVHGDSRVEGLLFDYVHFFGDYDHHVVSHGWYRHEIRVVRTGIGVRSWHDAQGFRRDGKKLHVKRAHAAIYHYGWVRPPRVLTKKAYSLAGSAPDVDYNYGTLHGLARFEGVHPAVMRARMAQMDWTVRRGRDSAHKQDRLGVRLLTFLERRVLGFRVGERKNYVLLRD